MLTVESLCMRLTRLIHTPVRIYNEDGTRIRTYADNGEQEDPIALDSALFQRLMEQRRTDCPSFLLDGEDVIYGIVSDEKSTCILGPCCLSRDPVTAARRLVRQHGMDRKKPFRIPCITLPDFSEVLLTLFECLTGISMDTAEFFLRSICNQRFEQELHEKIQQVSFARQDEAVAHNPYSQELIEQESIRTGDMEGLHRSFRILYTGRVGTLARDPLRQAQNLAIVNITLACRSAMEGGVLPEVSYTMADAFTQRVEEMRTEAEAYALMRQAEVEFCKAVADLSDSGHHGTLVVRFKELVAQRLHTRLLVKELAEELEVSTDYLSQTVLKEEGLKPTDYILREKVSDAKNQLIYSGRSYDEIAHSLSFSSQSHFGQVFKKHTGMTPRQFREYYRQQLEEDSSK